uniref:Coiled-coil domain-containing protein 12-like n=1 Tax=Sinocyclocheilus anshuiensis TaxID=1608454 RepID=A0A671LTV6_9TELE
MEKPVGSLQEQALKRKERLKALRDRQLQGQASEDGEPERKRALEDSETEDRHSARITGQPLPLILFSFFTLDLCSQDLANLAPRKPDWDLKRDVAKKLEKLERRTQKAIAELIRERLKGSEEELAGAD